MQPDWHAMPSRMWACFLAVSLFSFSLPFLLPASAQQSVGVVTGLQGRVDLSRQAAPTPVPLRFKDDLFLRDLVNTQQESVARMLFGGQSTVTVRELTRLEIRAELLPTGATRTNYDLADGKIRVNIAPKLIRPGDLIEIRTPNAVATVRGSVLITDYVSAIGRSLFTLLSGSAIITPAGQAPITLGPNSKVAITGTPATGTQASPIETVTAGEAAEANKGLEVGPAHTEEAALEQIAEAQLTTAAQLAAVLAGEPVSAAEERITVTDPLITEITKATISGSGPNSGEGVPQPSCPPSCPFILPGSTPLVITGRQPSEPTLTSLIELTPEATTTISTSLLVVNDSTLNVETNVLLVENATLTSTTTSPLLIVDPSTIAVGGNLVLVGSGGTLTLQGPLLSVTGAPASEGTEAAPSLIASAGALVAVSGDGQFTATITSDDPLVSLDVGILASGGPILDLQNSSLNLAGSVAHLTRGSVLATVAGPVIRLSGGSLTADALATTDGDGNEFILTGTLLELTNNSSVTLRTIGETADTDIVTFGLGVGQALIHMANSNLSLTGAGAPLVEFTGADAETTTQGGVALIATNTSETTKTISLAGPMLLLSGITLTDPNAQIQLSNMTVNQTGAEFEEFNELIEAFDFPVKVMGPLLIATDSILNIEFDVIGANDLTSTAAGHLISLQNSMLTSSGGGLLAATTANLAGPLLIATSESLIELGSDAIFVGSLNSTGEAPLLSLSSSDLTVAGKLMGTSEIFSPGTVELAGALLDAVNSEVILGDHVIEVVALTSRGTGALVSLENSPLTSFGSFLKGNGSIVIVPENGFGSLLLPGSASLQGSLLDATNSTVMLDGAVVFLGSLEYTGTDALVSLQNSPLTAASAMIFANFVTLDGPVLAAEGSPVMLDGPVLSVADLTSSTDIALVSLENSPLNADAVLVINSGLTGSGIEIGALVHQASLAGPVLVATDSAVTLTSGVISVPGGASLTSSTDAALVQLTGTSSLTVTGDLVDLGSGSALNLGGSLLAVSGPGTVAVSGSILTAAGATGTIGKDLVRVSGPGQLITGGSLLQLSGGSTVTTTDGALINAFAGGLVLIPGAGLESLSSGDSVTVSNAIASTDTINGVPVSRTNDAFISMGPGTGLEGVVFVNPDSIIVADGIGTLVTIDPVLLATGPFLTIDTDLLLDTALALFNIGSVPTPEPISPQTNRAVVVTAADAPEPGLQGQGIAQLSGPTITISSSTVTSTIEFVALSGTSLAIPGPLLNLTDSILDNTAGFGDLVRVGFSAILRTFGTEPLVQIDPSTVRIGGSFVDVDSILSLSGPLLSAIGTLSSPTNLASGDSFVNVVFGALTSTTTQALIQLTNSPVTTSGSMMEIGCGECGGTVNLAGSFLSATDSDLMITDSLVNILGDGQLNTSSKDPLVLLDGGTHTIGGGFEPSLFRLQAFNTDPITGVGTDSPVNFTGSDGRVGTLLKAIDGASVEIQVVEVGGHFLGIDTALLEASAPIIHLIGSSTAESSLTTAAPTLNLFQSMVTSLGPVIALDKGLINVTNGALINLEAGSKMDVTGDLLSLINGSRINVVNGPLIRVDGVSFTQSPSTMNVSGALVNFGGTGNNAIVVTNAIAPTATMSGLPVSATTGGSISIGPNPVKNPTLGAISVSNGGSLIQASNNGVVNIVAP